MTFLIKNKKKLAFTTEKKNFVLERSKISRGGPRALNPNEDDKEGPMVAFKRRGDGRVYW